MQSADPDLDDDSFDLTDELSDVSVHERPAQPSTRPARMPIGTIAPPLGGGEDLDALRAEAVNLREAESWSELARTIRRIIDVGQLEDSLGEDETLALYAELGALEGDALGHVGAAIEVWRKVLAIDPSDLRALTELEELLMRANRWNECALVIEQRALVLDDEAQRRDTLLQAAAVWEERIDDLTRAAEIYERVRGADPGDQVVSERLEVIYRQQQKWAELVEILLERSEAAAEVEQQIEILHAVANVYESELGDEESAFYVLQAAFNHDHAHAQTARELERLATATARWPELLEEYGKRAAELEPADAGAAAELWLTIAGAYRERLGHVDHAIGSVQQALRIDPRHPGALALIAALQVQNAESIEHQDDARAIEAYRQVLAHEPTSDAALRALERLYRRTEAWAPLVEILARRAQLSGDELDGIRLRLEIGSLCDARLADPAQAIAAYEQVRDVDPSNLAALRALDALYERTAQTEKHLAVLQAQLDATAADDDRIALYERIAAACEELGALDRAADAYEQLLALDSRNTAAHHLLARLYEQTGNHAALVAAHRNHVAATSDAAAKAELYVAMGKVYETALRDRDRAIDAYEDALSLDGGREPALDGLARLYEQAGEWERAIAVLARCVEQGDAARKPELYQRMGRLQYGELGDAEAAEASLLRGLAIAPGHLPAMEALIQQYSDRGDWLKAAQMMMRAESHTEVVIDKVRHLLAAANIYMDKLHAAQQAKPLYAAVIALDPEHVPAGRPLADLYFDAGEWTALSPLLDMLCRKVGHLRADPKELNQLHYRAARCAAALGDVQKALAHYKAAYDLDPTFLPTLLGRADLLFDAEDWTGAGKLYQTVLIEHRDGKNAADVVRVYGRLGAVRRELGERKRALDMFHKALELDPGHRETLHAVIDLQGQQGDWEAVVRAKRGLLETSEERERPKLLDEIAAVYRDRLQNPVKASAAYHEALELAPEDHRLLHKVLDLYIETKQWRKAVEIMERFVARETDSIRKGVYFHAAGTVCRDELKALDEAVDYYECALDAFFADPERLDEQQLTRALMSFEAIDSVLTTKRDWRGQERAYRDMIARLPKGDPRFYKLQVGLIDGLGELYRSRLKQYGDAAGVFEIAQQLDPDNQLRARGPDRAEILAELYLVAGASHADKAIEQHARMLRREPFKYDSYKTLARIYKSTQQYDKYWCVCSALKFLQKADPDELQLYEKYKPRGLVKAKSVMSPDSWAKLGHADENRYISAIFRACWQGVAAMKAFPHKDFGVKREDRRQLQGDQLMFSRLFLYLAQLLDVTVPEVYLVDDNKAAEIQLANAIEKTELCPSFVVRPHVLQGKSEREVAFLLARRLAFMRPEYYLRMLLPTNTELKVVLLSAIAMLQPRFPIPPNMVTTVEQYLPQMRKRMPPHALEQLDAVMQRFIQATPEINLAQWAHAVDAVSHRAGFVACGDLEISARAVAADPVVVDGPTMKDKVKELILFAISEEYFAVRAQLGVAIG